MSRVPPHDNEAERSWLGAALVGDVECALDPEDFYSENHATIYRCLRWLRGQGVTPDPIVVYDTLRRYGLDREIPGCAPYLHSLTSALPIVANAPHYAGIIRRHAHARRVLAAATDAIAELYAHLPPDEVEERLCRRLGLKS